MIGAQPTGRGRWPRPRPGPSGWPTAGRCRPSAAARFRPRWAARRSAPVRPGCRPGSRRRGQPAGRTGSSGAKRHMPPAVAAPKDAARGSAAASWPRSRRPHRGSRRRRNPEQTKPRMLAVDDPGRRARTPIPSQCGLAVTAGSVGSACRTWARLHGQGHQALGGVQPVLGLVPDHRVGSVDHRRR